MILRRRDDDDVLVELTVRVSPPRVTGQDYSSDTNKQPYSSMGPLELQLNRYGLEQADKTLR